MFPKQLGLALLGITASIAQAVTPQSLVQSLTDQELIKLGRESFVNRCSGCHGLEADGNGPAAAMLNPKPRNLVAGDFKFRSTPSGTLPTVEDLLRTIDKGIAGTSMPPFSEVASSEKLALVAYIRSLRSAFIETKPDRLAIRIAEPPQEMFATKAQLMNAAAKGRAHYTMACVSCHGTSGRGDGPAAPDLTDSDNRPIVPANLRLVRMKGGPTARDLFRAITTGLEGSPMPGFDGVFDETKRWEVVAYLYYLRGLEAGIYDEEKDKLP